jgi:hypothetical protein
LDRGRAKGRAEKRIENGAADRIIEGLGSFGAPARMTPWGVG